MNTAFLSLPYEKQQRIINAGLDVFSKHEYQKASTDDIASKASISKGSLFYYFKNKKSLYIYLFDYVYNIMNEFVIDDNFNQIDDFFELMSYAAKRKSLILQKNPFFLDFFLNCYFSNKEEVSDDIQQLLKSLSSISFSTYFKDINFHKFKDTINPEEIYNILFFASEGYMNRKKKLHHPIDVKEMMEDFNQWVVLFKKLVYKEEYQDESYRNR